MIEVFADIWCPFAHVGLRVVRTRRDMRAPGMEIRVRAWPLELVNGAPMDVAKTTRNVAALQEQLGVALFRGFNPDTFPTTTLPALALVAAAERAGRGEEVAYGVRDALWEEGLDVGDADVVADLVRSFGVEVTDADHQAVLDDYAEGQRRGVKGSPHFFCGSREEFCPSLAMARDAEGVLTVTPDPQRLEAFLEGCWR